MKVKHWDKANRYISKEALGNIKSKYAHVIVGMQIDNNRAVYNVDSNRGITIQDNNGMFEVFHYAPYHHTQSSISRISDLLV